MSHRVGILVQIDVNCEDVEFPTVESRAINCYDFLCSVTVDPRKVEPDGLTYSLSVRFLEAKDNVQSSDSAFFVVFTDRIGLFLLLC